MKILLAVDGSKHSRWAVQWLARLPLKTRPKITAVHVTDFSSLQGPFVTPPGVAGPELLNQTILQGEVRLLEKRAKEIVAETATLLASLKLKGQVKWRKGPVAETLLREAGRDSLIVLGSLGLGVLKKLLLGSVSMRVVLHASSPVLVVKQPPRPIRRLLLALDGSKASERALEFLRREFRPTVSGRKVTVLVTHVRPPMTVSAAVAPGVKASAEGAARALLDDAAARLEKAGFRTDTALEEGAPAEAITKVAERRKADLIVCGAKGLSGVAAFVLGSVSLKLAEQSRANTLVLR